MACRSLLLQLRVACLAERDSETGTDRQRQTQTDKVTERHGDTDTEDRRTDRRTDGQTDRERDLGKTADVLPSGALC